MKHVNGICFHAAYEISGPARHRILKFASGRYQPAQRLRGGPSDDMLLGGHRHLSPARCYLHAYVCEANVRVQAGISETVGALT
jgi:hypothetical protein